MMYFPILTDADKTLPLYLAGAGRQENQETIFRPEGFRLHQLFLITHGAGEFKYGGTTYPLASGDCWLVPKNIAHDYYATIEPFTTRWVSFDGESVTPLLRYFNTETIQVFRCGPFSALRLQHQSLMDAAAKNAEASTLSALLYQFVIDFLSAAAGTGTDVLDDVTSWLRTCYAEDLSLDDIAGRADLSRYELCRAFRRKYDMTPISFLTGVRLQKAKELLVTRDDLTVREIGALSGFHDPVYFGRVFRRYEGVTPRAFRLNRG